VELPVHDIPDNVTIPGLKTPKLTFGGLHIPSVTMPKVDLKVTDGSNVLPAKVSIGLPFPAKPHGKGPAGNAQINFTLPNPLLPKVNLKVTPGPMPVFTDLPHSPVGAFVEGKGAAMLDRTLPTPRGKGPIEPIVDLQIPNVIINPGKGVLTVGTNGPTTLTVRGPFGGAHPMGVPSAGAKAAGAAAPKAPVAARPAAAMGAAPVA
jgi:hypothetical protein